MGTGLDHSCWDAQVEAYQNSFECIVFDNRGTGLTESPEESLSVKLMAQDTLALLDQIGLDRYHVSGLSLGSCIAQELTLIRPGAVKSLQLHGTWARADGYVERKFKAQIRLLQDMDLRSFYEINLLWLITPDYMRQNPENVDRLIESIVTAAPSNPLLLQQYQANISHNTLHRLKNITSPTLVTVGSFDLATPPLYGREVADAIPTSRYTEFKGGSHLYNLEHPEEFNRITLEFLLSHSQ
jgi:pimeloyl-ACP methyl ester carboxylesterase